MILSWFICCGRWCLDDEVWGLEGGCGDELLRCFLGMLEGVFVFVVFLMFSILLYLRIGIVKNIFNVIFRF